ncbi:MAG: hypothetical protein Q8N84_00310 [bacterium]|nr:hypothetical protein [bacterium]
MDPLFWGDVLKNLLAELASNGITLIAGLIAGYFLGRWQQKRSIPQFKDKFLLAAKACEQAEGEIGPGKGAEKLARARELFLGWVKGISPEAATRLVMDAFFASRLSHE